MEFQLVCEQFFGKYACLGKPAHAFLYHAINIAIGCCNHMKIVMFNHVNQYVGKFQPHVLVSSHGGV